MASTTGLPGTLDARTADVRTSAVQQEWQRRRCRPPRERLATFLYSNPEARTAVATAVAEAGERRSRMVTEQDDEREATWSERELNAEDALKATRAEILSRRSRIGGLRGQIRDLEAEWTEDAIQRITTEDTTLKQCVRQLISDTSTLDERLKAACSNLRFQDRRVAGLEAHIPDPRSAT